MGEVTPTRAAFIDPGAHGAVAGVEWSEEARRPVALFALGILGEGDKWEASARARFTEAVSLLQRDTYVAWIEIPGDQVSWAIRTGKALRRRGQQDIRALSMRVGVLSAYWDMVSGAKPEPHQQRDWAREWMPAIPAGKKGGGEHRISEAGKLVPGSEALLRDVPKSCRVDAAECLLGAAAALMAARRRGVKRSLGGPIEQALRGG